MAILVLAAFLAAPLLFAAVEEYKKAVELDGNSVVKRYNLGFAYYNEGKYDDAIDALKTTLDMNSGDRESHEKVDVSAAQILGIIFFNYKNNDDEAIKYFSKVAELKPSDGDNYFYTGLSYLRKGDKDRAMQAFSTALNKGTENSIDAEFRIGQIYYKKDQFGDAIPHLEKAIEKSSKSETAVDAMEMLGIIYHKRENAGKAIGNLTGVVKSRPENFNAYYLLGLNYFKQKKYDSMISAYKKAITINPGFADAHYNLGMAYYYRNEFEDAIKEFEQAKNLNPNDSAVYSILAQAKTAAYEYHLSRGTINLTEEKYFDAINEFSLALSAKPGDGDARKYLNDAKDSLQKKIPEKLASAKEFYSRGKYAEAYNEWDFVRRADPSNSEAQDGIKKVENNLSDLIAAKEKSAQSYAAQGNFDEAIADLKAIENMAVSSQKKEITGKIASVREKQRAKVESLLASAEKAYSDRSYKSALNKYNEVLKYDRNNDDALNGITKVKSVMDSEKEKYLALAKQNKENAAKSAQYYKKVLDIDATNMEAQNGVEQATGRKSQVALNAGKVKELYYQGVDRYVNGEIEDAIRIWKKVLTIDPAHVEAAKNIKRAQEKLAAIQNLSR
jgi:tetratricopeptide (TPR) repeat protein